MKNLTLLLLLCLNQAVMAQPDMKPDTGTMPGKAFMGGDVHGSHGHFMSMPGAERMMMHHLYSPELIMRHQDELNLTAAQVDAIKKEMKTYQTNSIDEKWDIQSASDGLRKELEKNKIDKQQALSWMDKLMAAKTAVKKQHLSMLITIHNILSQDQIEKLKHLSCPAFHHFMQTPPMPMPNKQS